MSRTVEATLYIMTALLFLMCNGCSSSPEPLRPLPATTDSEKPVLERSENVEDAVAQALDLDEIRIFKWRAGLLEGKINLQKCHTLTPIDVSAVVRELSSNLHEKVVGPRTISGVVVISIEKPTRDATNGRPCRVCIRVQLKSSTQALTFRGVIPGEKTGHVKGPTDFEEYYTSATGQSFTLYKLNLRAEPADANQGAVRK